MLSPILILAVAAAVAKPQPATLLTPQIIGEGDYPAEAIDNDEEGSVEIKLFVGPDGAVADCEVVDSSGSSALDAQTCNLYRLRAKFSPAKDSSGRPTTAEVVQRINWRLEGETFPNESWTRRQTIVVPRTGPATCRSELVGPESEDVSVECPKAVVDSWRSAPQFADQTVVRVRNTVETQFVRGAARTIDPPTQGKPSLEIRAVVKVAADGKTESCESTQNPETARGRDPCKDFRQFEPLIGPGGKPVPFTATLTQRVFLEFEKAD